MDNINIAPSFQGVAVHDFWQSYYNYQCEHALRDARLLRDLIFVKERFKQSWAQDLTNLLLKRKESKHKAIAHDKTCLSNPTLEKYRQQYNHIIQRGFNNNPFNPQKVDITASKLPIGTLNG